MPPGPGPSPLRLTLFALFAIATAQQQQQHSQNVQHSSSLRSPPENAALRPVTPIEASPANEASRLNLAPNYKHKKDTAPLYLRNERAVATIAPADGQNPAVRAPSDKPAAGPSGALSPRRARSLRDWGVENIVLLATVEGSLHGRSRTTGQELWTFYSDRPMVDIVYHRKGTQKELGDAGRNDPQWIIEPNQDGNVFIIPPGPSVQVHKLDLTIKQLHELSPYASEDSPYVYTAEKRNTLLTLNATNGVALKYFSAGGSAILEQATCRKVSDLEIEDDEDECEPTPTIHLGRTEYTVSIQDRDSGERICTIYYFEWTPNNRDRDLQAQYLTTLDNKYIYPRFDGGIVALEHKKQDDKSQPERLLYKRKFSDYPVVQVFDVARPHGADVRDVPWVILPQPVPPIMSPGQTENIFVNFTESGSPYALSEAKYPSVTDGAAEAQCYKKLPWDDLVEADENPRAINQSELIGVHSLLEGELREESAGFPTIGGPSEAEAVIIPPFGDTAERIAPSNQIYVAPPKTGPYMDFSWVSVITILILSGIVVFQSRHSNAPIFPPAAITRLKEMVPMTANISPKSEPKAIEAVDPASDETSSITVIQEPAAEKVSEPSMEPERKVRFAMEEESLEAKNDIEAPLELTTSITPEPVTEISETDESPLAIQDAGETGENTPSPPSPEAPKKKKTHRGQRGGRKRNKNKTQDKEKEEADEEINRIVEGVVPHDQSIQPDERTIIESDAQDVSGTIQVGDLVIHTEKVLGYGSGGTIVYEGTFGKRQVAVKRMLLQYFDLAEQEIKLLATSDDHPNVIRYYTDVKGRDFLYIAVERCQASLWDLFKDGPSFDGLSSERLRIVQDINPNVEATLYQLAAGLNHLHSLRIIHRDIKPQNILVAYPKQNQKNGPRLIISDFGLCKMLPDNVSTLAGTMGNAGTIGWKAPELIGQPLRGTAGKDGSLNGNSTDPITASNNGTATQGSLTSDQGGLAVSSGGVKRSVDIFSLGCVFYYILTNGFHPYDSDSLEVWHFERELNIKKGKQNLRKLDEIGSDAQVPLHLIQWMLSAQPEHRPTARQVMAHPFFWSKLKRLNFLCDVSDHFEQLCRDPPERDLIMLEDYGQDVHDGDFLKRLDRKFIDTLGKQRKYTADRMLDLLRALRNKKNHYADMPDDVKARVGELPGGYLQYWTSRFPHLIMHCWMCVRECGIAENPRFKEYMSIEE